MRTLILGGARSGKSRHAEALAAEAEARGQDVVYVATGQALDGEMTERIAHHRTRRPPTWRTVEEPLALAATLAAWAKPDRCVIVDCLTLWLTNLMLDPDPARLGAERAAFLAALPDLPGEILLVSNEVGMGLVALDPLGRRFVDESGRLHQDVAAVCDRVTWVVAGCPMRVKGW